jgi:hypothetical protein
MNPNNLTKGLYSIRAVLIPALVGVLSVPSAFSTIVFQDNFKNYTDDASLTAVWPRASGTETSIFLTPDPSDASNQTIQQTTAAGRLRHVVEGGIVPTAVEPTISYSFDLYDPNPIAGGRVFAELRSSATANGLLGAGIYNSATYGTYDATKYMARTIDEAGVSKWMSLDTPRSQGWHNFRFELNGNRADLYVDNVLEPKFGEVGYAGGSYDWVHVGSALSAGSGAILTGAFFDNVNVSIVPEPPVVTLGLLGLGALLGITWLRRR